MAGTNFILHMAAAWMDAAEFADARAQEAARRKDSVRVFWEERADRYEAQSKLVLDLTQTDPERAAA